MFVFGPFRRALGDKNVLKESPELWERLIEAKVDLITTDSILGLREFLLGRSLDSENEK